MVFSSRLARRIVVAAMLVVMACAAPALLAQTDQFVPASQLPPQETIPAARLVFAAYAFVWVVLIVYVWSVWRRVGSVERDVAELRRQVAARTAARS